MKVSELLESDMSYDAKRKHVRGDLGDWLSGMGVYQEDIDAGRSKIEASPEYKRLLGLGFKDTSTSKHKGNGTFAFEYHYDRPYAARDGWRKIAERLKYSVLANGKIDVTQKNDYHRYAFTSPKPTVVVGKPVDTVIKTAKNAMAHLADKMEVKLRKIAKEISASDAE